MGGAAAGPGRPRSRLPSGRMSTSGQASGGITGRCGGCAHGESGTPGTLESSGRAEAAAVAGVAAPLAGVAAPAAGVAEGPAAGVAAPVAGVAAGPAAGVAAPVAKV